MASKGYRNTNGKVFEANISTTKVNNKNYFRISVPPETVEAENLRKGDKVRVKIVEVKK